jgi:hypothetical protein
MNENKKVSTSSEGDENSEVQESSYLGSNEEVEVLESVTNRKFDKIARLLPIHAVVSASKGISRQVGRPRKIERKPVESDLEYHEMIVKERAEFIEEDPIVRSIQNRSDTAELMNRIKEEVARETAALHHQRLENGKFGRDTAQISTRRIDGLKKIAEIELEIKRMGADTINLKSERMQKLFQYIIAAFREGCVQINMSPEQIDLLFNHLSTNLEGWEEKAAELVR